MRTSTGPTDHQLPSLTQRCKGFRLISNQEISIQLTVRVVDNTGAVLRDEYAELHQTTTNYNGLFTIEIGSGSAFLGSFDQVHSSFDIHYDHHQY